MQKQFRLPLIFFFIASVAGVILRGMQMGLSFEWNYTYLLHTHSHVMFLGWVFNGLYLVYVQSYIPYSRRKRYLVLFNIIQSLIVGMLFSFPVQGYGLFSILFSTFHIFAVAMFVYWFFRDTSWKAAEKQPLSLWFAKASLIFFILSSLGPFALGPMVANGLGQTTWYYLAVYYYLHFQYNGVFAFGVLAVVLRLFKLKQIMFNVSLARQSGMILFIACIPAYTLSALWINPGIIFNCIGGVSAVAQIVALFLLIKVVRSVEVLSWKSFTPASRFILAASFASFGVKYFLQLLSAHPAIAQLAYENRSYVIAYLHLVLIGVVSLPLIAWYFEHQLVKGKVAGWGLGLLFGSFVGTELVLAAVPSLALTGMAIRYGMEWLFGLSIALAFGVLLINCGYNRAVVKNDSAE